MVTGRLDDPMNVWMEQEQEPRRTADYDNDPRRVAQRLSIIRKAMSAALRRKDRAEYHRLGAEHRAILHAASPEIRAAWERAQTTK
jgi:hypothetical protein